MLKYKIRMTPDQVAQETLKWTERYASPDLTFVSGVTDTSYNLQTFKSLSVESKAGGGTDIVHVIAKNVRRDGYVFVNDKKYYIKSGTTKNHIIGETVTYRYVELNGKYYYENNNKFYIDNWLSEVNYKIVEKDVTATTVTAATGDYITLDTICWIEDGMVTIDDNEYYVDMEEMTKGLRYYKDGDKLPYSAVTQCISITVQAMTPGYVTKFMLMKVPDREVRFDSVGFCDYYFFVLYKGTYCHVVPSGGTYVCLVPKELLDDVDGDGYSVLSLYRYVEDMGGGEIELTGSTNSISDPITLRDMYTFVKIGNGTLQVDHTVVSSNGGSRVMVYLSNDAIVKNLNPGNKINFRNNEMDAFFEVYDDEDGKEFVLYNGKKYFVEKNLCDKALMAGFEYDIEYPNGKKPNVDCLVNIEGERIKMTINSDVTKVAPYPKHVISSSTVGDDNKVQATSYTIVEYDGVIIDGKKYLVHVEMDGNNNIYQKYVVYDKGNNYSMVVEEIIGSSAVVCYPDIHSAEFSDTFIKNWQGLIMTSVVYGADNMSLYVPNTIFGTQELTPQLAVTNLMAVLDNGGIYIPKSSTEYYDITDDLLIYVNNRYINVPLMLDMNNGGNPLQSDLVEKGFYEVEKKKAINKIVDMERDVYNPKVLTDNTYNGASSTFKDISEIQINLHFRTRNENWKVNEASKTGWDVTTSGKSNWFITDSFQYATYYNNHSSLGNIDELKKLDTASDIVGLLNFTNNDIYYQKSRVANSFLRLSYYDSVDPQTQSLLHTSTVFMDEHALYKKYIDNSRRGENVYLTVTEETRTDKYADFIHDAIVSDNWVNWIKSSVTKPDYLTSTSTHAEIANWVVSSGFTHRDMTMAGMGVFYGETRKIINKISVKSEPVSATTVNGGYDFYESGMTFDEDHRLSSRFTIKNKYATDTSSEGFYLYIFKEYSTELHPKVIYMKVEFNHAGIGQTLPFMRPMIFGSDNYPQSGITLSKSSDVAKLKEGIKLQDFYSQIYIPLYAVFDYKNKEYAYVFDNRYVKVENGVAVINLFEVKIKDESDSDDEAAQLKINNNSQFPNAQ